MKACLSVFNEFGEGVPMFVSHCLDKLPPVGFGSRDTSALLRRIEQLSSEVSGLRRTTEAQADVNENLTAATAALNRRVTAMEESCTMDLGHKTAATAAAAGPQGGRGTEEG